MTVQRAIELLQAMREKHGDVEVFFDCPSCGKAFRPGHIAAVVTIQQSPTR